MTHIQWKFTVAKKPRCNDPVVVIIHGQRSDPTTRRHLGHSGMVAADDHSVEALQEPTGNREALNQMFNIVQGPPRTGKMRTIAQACVECYNKHVCGRNSTCHSGNSASCLSQNLVAK